MLVLKTIGVLAVLWLVYYSTKKIDGLVYDKFKHSFLDTDVFAIGVASSLITAWGYGWYSSALKSDGDLLNGGIIMGIGILGFILLTLVNIKSTNLLVGVIGSALQIAVFGAATIFLVLYFLLLAAWYLHTRPVYVVNND